MPDKIERPEQSDAEYYKLFVTGLSGLLNAAEFRGYSPEAIAFLQKAYETFWEEFHARHPGAWSNGIQQ